jgi:hypothetical protein
MGVCLNPMPYYLLNTTDATPMVGKVLREHETPDAAKADRSGRLGKPGAGLPSLVIVQTVREFPVGAWVPKDAVLNTFN